MNIMTFIIIITSSQSKYHNPRRMREGYGTIVLTLVVHGWDNPCVPVQVNSFG